MNHTTRTGIGVIERGLELVRIGTADREPAPVSVLLLKDRITGTVHRAFRIEGIHGFARFPGCALEHADVVPDLSKVSDETTLHPRCFGPLDAEVEEYGQRAM